MSKVVHFEIPAHHPRSSKELLRLCVWLGASDGAA